MDEKYILKMMVKLSALPDISGKYKKCRRGESLWFSEIKSEDVERDFYFTSVTSTEVHRKYIKLCSFAKGYSQL